MQNYKRTLLSLSVAGVLSGTVLTYVHATDITTNQKGTTVSGISDNVINVNYRQTADDDGGVNEAALTVDVTDSTSTSVALEADININAEIDGTVNDDGTDLDANKAKGLFITDSSDDTGTADTLKGSINVNANIKGGSHGLQVGVDIEGDVTIVEGAEVSGDKAVVIGNVTGNINNVGVVTSAAAAVDGAAFTLGGTVNNGVTDNSEPVTNSGTIKNTNETDGIALKIESGAVLSGPIRNAGTISGKTAINAEETFGLNNTGVIEGDITVASSKTATISNSGVITGDFDGGGTIDITNESGGEITSETMNVNNLTNDVSSTINTKTLTAAGTVANNNYLNVTETFSATTGIVENAGTMKVGDIDADAGFTNETSGIVDVTGLFDVSGAKLANEGTVTAGTLTATGGFDNGTDGNKSAVMKVNGVLTIDADSTNEGSLYSTGFTTGNNAFTNTGLADLGQVTGSSSGTITNSGTLTLKEGSSLGVFNQSGGTLKLESTSGGTILATTTANFTNSSKLLVVVGADAMKQGSGSSISGSDVTLISGTINGEDNVSVESDNAFVILSAASGSGIVRKITILDADDIVKDIGYGASTQSLAKQLQGLGTDTDQPLSKVTSAYGTLSDNAGSTDELTKYLDNIRPDDSGSSAHTASEAVTGAQNSISDRGVYTRSGINTGGMIAAGSMWMQAVLSKSKQDSREGSLAYNGDMVGYTIGTDGEWGNNTTGVAFTYGSSDVDFERDQKDKVKSYIGSVYNTWQSKNWYLDGSLSFGLSKHEGRRMQQAAALSSEYDSMQFGGMGTLGTYIPVQRMVIEPMVGVRANHVKVGGYTAKNGDGSLTEVVGKSTYEKIEGGLGAAFSTVANYGKTSFQPRIAFMYYRDFIGDKIDHQVNFAGEDYTLQGVAAEKNTYELKAGLNIWNESNMELTLGYTRVMQKDFSSDNFNFKFKYNY